MKRLIIAAVAGLCAIGAYAQRDKGDMVMDLGIGVGTMGTADQSLSTGSHAMFTQRIGAEWIIVPKMINGDFELALGGYINNAYGKRDDVVYGWRPSSSEEVYARRECKRDDITLIPTVSFRYNVNPRFQVYATCGIGLAILNAYDESYTPLTYNVYPGYRPAFPDAGGVYWSMDTGTRCGVAVSSYAGLRYFFNDCIGVNAQIGVIAASVCGDWGSSENYLSGGISFRF